MRGIVIFLRTQHRLHKAGVNNMFSEAYIDRLLAGALITQDERDYILGF